MTALGDICLIDGGIRSDKLRDLRRILGVNLPVIVIQIQCALLIQKVHVRLPQRVDGSDILPVPLELVSHQPAAVPEKSRNDILAKIMA